MSDTEVEIVNDTETETEQITKPKKKYEFTEARRAALERAQKARSDKAKKRDELKKETEQISLQIIEDRKVGKSQEDDKLETILFQLENMEKHFSKNSPPKKNESEFESEPPPPPKRKIRKKPPPPPDYDSNVASQSDTESEPTFVPNSYVPPPNNTLRFY